MRTIPRHLPSPLPPGERRVTCGCGMVWHRSDCVRSDEGIWLCPDEQDGGRTGTTLDRTNQQNALSGWVPRGPREPY